MKHRYRLIIAITLVLITLAAFGYYISSHEYIIRSLAHISPYIILWLILLYILWFFALVILLFVSLTICNKTINLKENILLNAYSVLVNFFIPGQGGIAVRGVYLKKVKNLAYRNYIYVSLLYFMIYAIVSIILLLAFSSPLWQTILATIIIGSVAYGVIYFYRYKSKTKLEILNLNKKSLLYLILATLFQSIVQIAIFAVELHYVNPNISLHQAITYTGAANFSLFVALTPGAIGIRESFLLLSRHLHHISSANIISASIIDRAVFILFLGLMFVMTILLHAKYKNFIRKPVQSGNND